ncbi:MAG: ATP-binding protein [Planctomycetota bacterium]|jgi:CO dehydrogenase maturation factor
MAKTIAVSGKGGSGKTTLAAMIIRSLLARADSRAVLAVDADPNSCLGLMLGVQPLNTVADIREDVRAKPPAGVDRVRSIEYGIQQAITEAAGFDLLTMGRPEGPDCYCAVNNLLRKFLDELSSQYQFVIMDNEAGMEHLSRRTTNNVDLLCIVAEPSSLGALTAQRIFELARQLPIAVEQIGVIWNKTADTKKLNAIETFGSVPYDKAVSDASMQGKTIFDLQEDSPAFLAVRKILEHRLNLKSDKSISSMKRDARS